jgi:hypothetical protein
MTSIIHIIQQPTFRAINLQFDKEIRKDVNHNNNQIYKQFSVNNDNTSQEMYFTDTYQITDVKSQSMMEAYNILTIYCNVIDDKKFLDYINKCLASYDGFSIAKRESGERLDIAIVHSNKRYFDSFLSENDENKQQQTTGISIQVYRCNWFGTRYKYAICITRPDSYFCSDAFDCIDLAFDFGIRFFGKDRDTKIISNVGFV